MAYKPIENLKGHVKSRPPLVILIGCMFLFALSVIILGYYFRHSDVRNFDISEDWNTFLGDLSDVDFCLYTNTSTTTVVHSTATTLSPGSLDNVTATASSDPFPAEEYGDEDEDDWTTRRNLTVALTLVLEPSVSLLRSVANITLMSSLVPASMLGLEGSNEFVSVQFEMPPSLKDQKCDDFTKCGLAVQTCLTMIAPAAVFPLTKQPASCNVTETRHENSTAWLTVRQVGQSQEGWCRHGTVAHAKHKFDPKLTVMLSPAEQSLINLHLMYTSYFMFVMVIMWVCYALVKGPPTKMRNVHATPCEKKAQLNA
jgi:hypothetical protein